LVTGFWVILNEEFYLVLKCSDWAYAILALAPTYCLLFLLSFSISMAVLSHRKAASAGTTLDGRRAQENRKINILYKHQHM
jgi:hypothetical protein